MQTFLLFFLSYFFSLQAAEPEVVAPSPEKNLSHYSITAYMYSTPTERDLVGTGELQGGDGKGDERIQLTVGALGHTVEKVEVLPQKGSGRIWSSKPSKGEWLLLVGDRLGLIKNSDEELKLTLHSYIESFDVYLQDDGSLKSEPYEVRVTFAADVVLTTPLHIEP